MMRRRAVWSGLWCDGTQLKLGRRFGGCGGKRKPHGPKKEKGKLLGTSRNKKGKGKGELGII